MGKNSIFSNLTKDDIIASIKMALSADFNHKKCVVIVEGIDDISFFNGKLSDDVQIYESFSGKDGVIDIANAFSEDRVIGICDKDYDCSQDKNNIFYYDCSCLEMMLISNREAFKSVVNTHYMGDKKSSVLKRFILHDLTWLSTFRRLSAENNWAINFEGISFEKAFDANHGCLITSKLLAKLDKINGNKIISNTPLVLIVEAESKKRYTIKELLNITQGHDFVFYFQIICIHNKIGKMKAVNSNDISKGLLCSYRLKDFCKTHLYKALLDYEKTYKHKVVPD